jgi:hypothetical protein
VGGGVVTSDRPGLVSNAFFSRLAEAGAGPRALPTPPLWGLPRLARRRCCPGSGCAAMPAPGVRFARENRPFGASPGEKASSPVVGSSTSTRSPDKVAATAGVVAQVRDRARLTRPRPPRALPGSPARQGQSIGSGLAEGPINRAPASGSRRWGAGRPDRSAGSWSWRPSPPQSKGVPSGAATTER